MERLEGVRRKLDRAKEMIEEIYDAVVGYIAEEPYEVVGEFNPETSEYVIRGKVSKPTGKIGIIAGDAAHNLRSALDHLAWQLALLNTATPYRLTQFPIARSKREFRKDRSQNMIRDISPQHRARIESFQPFNGTDKAWAPFALRDLQVLSNTDKHRVINTTVARTVRHREMMHGERVVIVRDATSFRDEAWFEGGPIDGAEIVRVVLEGVGPDPKVTVEGLIAVTVCFDDPALMRPHPNVVSLLRAIYKSVGEVVAAFEPDL